MKFYYGYVSRIGSGICYPKTFVVNNKGYIIFPKNKRGFRNTISNKT